MVRITKRQQTGMTLIEVLIAMLILAIGLLGAAGVQLNALKSTDSALMSTQASFIAYDMLDRMRANAGSDYSISGLDQVSPASMSVVGQDLRDFKRNVQQFGGARANGAITVTGRQVRITLQWNDSRASKREGTLNSFILNSQIVADATVKTS